MTVVITGMGPVTPSGVGLAEFHEAQLSGRSGVGPITRFDTTGYAITIAGEVDLPARFTPSSRELARSDRATHLVSAAAALAIEHSGIDFSAEDSDRVAVVVGTGSGGLESSFESGRDLVVHGPQAVAAGTAVRSMPNSAGSHLAVLHGLNGPCVTIVNACSSGADAIAAGLDLIRAGRADVVLACGVEASVNPLAVASFTQIRALSRYKGDPTRASRPFSVDRDGFVIAEGAGALVLESATHAAARGAIVHAELAGAGRTVDGFHLTRPRPDGVKAARAIDLALRDSAITADEVDFVNAHGTGTVLNDAAEPRALHLALAERARRIPVTATKSLIGHTLGAAGAIEAIATVQALTSGWVPPTLNLHTQDPGIDLDVVHGEPRKTSARVALSTNFAFGGHNTALVFRVS